MPPSQELPKNHPEARARGTAPEYAGSGAAINVLFIPLLIQRRLFVCSRNRHRGRLEDAVSAGDRLRSDRLHYAVMNDLHSGHTERNPVVLSEGLDLRGNEAAVSVSISLIRLLRFFFFFWGGGLQEMSSYSF